MILRNTNGRDLKLERTMTVDEFIKEIVENDNERVFKYYVISLKANLHSRNMRLYYQDGVLKSQHTTGSKLDYNDYLNYEIWESYCSKYRTVDNIWNYSYDSNAGDGNKPKKIDNERRDPKKFKEKCDKIFEEIRIKDEARAKINKIKWNLKGEEITFEDLVKCVKQLTWDVDSCESENRSLRSDLNRLKEENQMLYSQIKWLEYKIDLLQKKNIDDRYKNFNPDNFNFK